MTGFPPGGGPGNPGGPGGFGPGPGGYPGPAAQRPGPPAPPPPPPPGGYPPQTPYQPTGPQQGQFAPSPPRSRGSGSGVVASLVALVVVVGGVLATVLLATSDGNKKVPVAGAPSGSRLPSGASRLPSGATGVPTSLSTSSPVLPPGAGTPTGFTSAAALGTAYFNDLAEHLFFTPRGLWCVPSAFPLTVADVNAVTSAVSQGPVDPSASTTSVAGSVSLNDGRSGTVTIVVQQQSGGSYCIVSQTSNLS